MIYEKKSVLKQQKYDVLTYDYKIEEGRNYPFENVADYQ